MSDRARAHVGPGVVVALLGLALAYSSWIAVQEFRAQAIDVAAAALPERPQSDQGFLAIAAGCGEACPPRGHRAAAAGLLKVARTSLQAHEVYDLAAGHARHALAREPLSADGWALLAAAQAGAGDQFTPQVGTDLEQSYHAARRSRTAAAWRILFCARHWTVLDADLRRQALTEFVWLAAIDRPQAERLLSRIQNPAANLAFSLSLDPEPSSLSAS
ncbi:hypothetical protein [Caulobacter sp. LARHSG274]